MAENPTDLMATGKKIVDMAHDLSNHLNRLVLQASCVQLHVDVERKKEIEVIRQEGIQAAALVAALRQIGQEMQKLKE